MSLQDFYHSRPWEKFLASLKSQRVQSDGFIHCAFCGKPIVRAYDCIGHHTVPLTEENYMDTEIALNPKLIELVHHKCHNRIHNKLGYAGREVFLVYGAPLSGKSTWVAEAMDPGDLVLDIDNIWQCVSGQGRYIKPGRLNAVVFGLRDRVIEMIRYRLGKWQRAYIIGGYPLCSERERICGMLGAREVYIECPMDVCMSRLQSCEDGRNTEEWKKYIADWFRQYIPPTFLKNIFRGGLLGGAFLSQKMKK